MLLLEGENVETHILRAPKQASLLIYFHDTQFKSNMQNVYNKKYTTASLYVMHFLWRITKLTRLQRSLIHFATLSTRQ